MRPLDLVVSGRVRLVALLPLDVRLGPSPPAVPVHAAAAGAGVRGALVLNEEPGGGNLIEPLTQHYLNPIR